jgi:hypothetical protein
MPNTVVMVGTGATIGSGYTRCGGKLPGDRGFFSNRVVRELLGGGRYPALELMLTVIPEVAFNGTRRQWLEEVWTLLEFVGKKFLRESVDLK